MAGKSPAADVTTGETAAEMLDQGYASEDPEVIVSGEAVAGKGPNVTVTTGEAVVGVPSQGHIASLTIHDVPQSEEPPKLQVESSGAAIKGMSLEEFLEKFAEDEENEKVTTDFYPLSSDTVMFQRSEIPAEGQSLLAAIVRKHPHFIAGCKLGASLRKSGLQLLIAVLLNMQCTKLESSNLKKALEWKNALKIWSPIHP